FGFHGVSDPERVEHSGDVGETCSAGGISDRLSSQHCALERLGCADVRPGRAFANPDAYTHTADGSPLSADCLPFLAQLGDALHCDDHYVEGLACVNLLFQCGGWAVLNRDRMAD